jgi:hypothetical protein
MTTITITFTNLNVLNEDHGGCCVCTTRTGNYYSGKTVYHTSIDVDPSNESVARCSVCGDGIDLCTIVRHAIYYCNNKTCSVKCCSLQGTKPTMDELYKIHNDIDDHLDYASNSSLVDIEIGCSGCYTSSCMCNPRIIQKELGDTVRLVRLQSKIGLMMISELNRKVNELTKHHKQM